MVPRDEEGVSGLVGLSIWTVKSPRMEAEVRVERNTVSQVPESPCVVEDVLPALLPTKAWDPRAEIHLCPVLESISLDLPFLEALSI